MLTKKRAHPEIDPVDILLKTSAEEDRKILQILAEAAVNVRREPQTGLVMMTVTDGAGVDFHLGEVLVTEAEVEYEGKLGYAMILGHNPEKALARAGVSAMMEGPATASKTRLYQYLVREFKKIRSKEKKAEALSASTKVHFESMSQW